MKKLTAAKERQRFAEESRVAALERLAATTKQIAELQAEVARLTAELEQHKEQIAALKHESELNGQQAARAKLAEKWALLLQFVDADGHAAVMNHHSLSSAAPHGSSPYHIRKESQHRTPEPPTGHASGARSSHRHLVASTSGHAAHSTPPLSMHKSKTPTPPTSPSVPRATLAASIEQLDELIMTLQGTISRIRSERIKLTGTPRVGPVSGGSAADEANAKLMNDVITCVVCLDRTRSTVLLPCSHVVMCSACAHDDGLLGCPLCRTPIDSVMDVFLS